MSDTLSIYSLTLAAGDATSNNNPSLRYFDWKRQIQQIPVKNPVSTPMTIGPGVEALVFDGTRATSIDGTSAFALTLSPLSPDRYRITWTGGTDPVFRVDRGLNTSGIVLTLAVQLNGTLTVTAGSGTPFAAMQVGDLVFIPGVSTGDASTPFNPVNDGYWTVLAATSTVLTLTRLPGEDFVAIGEVVTPASAAQFLGFSNTGVQAGDSLEISAGFSAATLKSYAVLAVTSKWVEIESATPLASQSATPGASGLSFYSSSKRYVRIEADQDCAIRTNGDTGSTQRLSPWVSGDPQMVGEYVKTGPTWSLKIFNRSSVSAKVVVLSVE